jgi:uncharacterized membrane protein
MTKKSKLPTWVARTSGYQKLLISLLCAVSCYAATHVLHISSSTRIILSWDVFAVAMITMSWLLFFNTTAAQQREIVKRQDDDIRVIFGIVLIAVCISLIATVLLILSTDESVFDRDLRTIVTLAAVTASWILLHTIFTIRYAHLYHNYDNPEAGIEGGGIDFPNAEKPDYIDFAYFSFVIGMTFQVSDVTISSKMVRRYVLMHSLISFVFNTIIVALTVNVIAGISK